MREICTSGSVGDRAGNRSVYPTGFASTLGSVCMRTPGYRLWRLRRRSRGLAALTANPLRDAR